MVNDGVAVRVDGVDIRAEFFDEILHRREHAAWGDVM
jgi:hypothetical protein